MSLTASRVTASWEPTKTGSRSARKSSASHRSGSSISSKSIARLVRECARLPDLEALKRTQHYELRGGHVALGVGSLAPVAQSLLAVSSEPAGLARALHFDNAPPRPDQVQELALLRFLETCASVLAVSAVASEQLVQERLCLGALTALVQAPLTSEVDEPRRISSPVTRRS